MSDLASVETHGRVDESFRSLPAKVLSDAVDLIVVTPPRKLLHLALKACYPAALPFPLLHIDTTWKFREMIAFRDRRAAELGVELIVHTNEAGLRDGISPIQHGSVNYTDVMKTEALRQALDAHGFDCAIGGARRDEEGSRAKERIMSLRTATHGWDPRRQRPELWCRSIAIWAKAKRRAAFP